MYGGHNLLPNFEGNETMKLYKVISAKGPSVIIVAVSFDDAENRFKEISSIPEEQEAITIELIQAEAFLSTETINRITS